MKKQETDQGAPPAQSKASHTSGPWESISDNSVRRPHVIRATASRAIIAHTYWDGDLMADADEPSANAKLIASAPALADALEMAFREMVNEAGHIGADDYHEAINRAGAALRLAGRLP